MKILVISLYLTVIISALQNIILLHQTRQIFIDVQELSQEQDMLNEHWGRLRLEKGTWETDDRVEKVARTELDMVVPNSRQIIFLRQ